jgi:membrane protease subunit (stomatin/prohibitin family)
VGNQDDTTQAGAFLGIGLGLGVWIVLWFAIAGPAIIVYFVLGKKQPSAPAAQFGRTATSRLCIEYGKYYDGEPKFCPNCGKPVAVNR